MYPGHRFWGVAAGWGEVTEDWMLSTSRGDCDIMKRDEGGDGAVVGGCDRGDGDGSDVDGDEEGYILHNMVNQ
jgi:hypothetical protein